MEEEVKYKCGAYINNGQTLVKIDNCLVKFDEGLTFKNALKPIPLKRKLEMLNDSESDLSERIIASPKPYNWTPEMTELLLENIKLYSHKLQHKYSKKKKVWYKIWRNLNDEDPAISIDQVEKKWQNIVHHYRKFIEITSKTDKSRMHRPKYFDEIKHIMENTEPVGPEIEDDISDTEFEPPVNNNTSSKNYNWNRQMTQLLIENVKTNSEKLQDKYVKKRTVWYDIWKVLNEADPAISIDQVGKKWQNIVQHYKKYLENMSRVGKSKMKRPEYFEEITEIIGNTHAISPQIVSSCSLPTDPDNLSPEVILDDEALESNKNVDFYESIRSSIEELVSQAKETSNNEKERIALHKDSIRVQQNQTELLRKKSEDSKQFSNELLKIISNRNSDINTVHVELAKLNHNLRNLTKNVTKLTNDVVSMNDSVNKNLDQMNKRISALEACISSEKITDFNKENS